MWDACEGASRAGRVCWGGGLLLIRIGKEYIRHEWEGYVERWSVYRGGVSVESYGEIDFFFFGGGVKSKEK